MAKRAPILREEPGRIGAADTVYHLRDARDLVDLRGQHLRFRVAMTALCGRGGVPVPYSVVAERLRLVADGLGASVPLPNDQRLEAKSQRQKFFFAPGRNVDQRNRKARVRAAQESPPAKR